MIWLNFLRDLKSSFSRLVSVILITAIAVMVYVALGGITYNVHRFCSTYFAEQNVADYWISGMGFDRSDCRALEALDGVTGVSISFMSQKMVLEAPDDRFDSVLAEAKKIIKKIEPDVTVKI